MQWPSCKLPVLLELADKIPPIGPNPLQDDLGGIPRFKQNKLGLALEPIACMTQQFQGQGVLGRPPLCQTRKATGGRRCPSVHTNSTTETPKTTLLCLLDQTQAASPNRWADGFSTTVSSMIR